MTRNNGPEFAELVKNVMFMFGHNWGVFLKDMTKATRSVSQPEFITALGFARNRGDTKVEDRILSCF